MTLREAIEMRLRQARLVGWRLSKRRQVELVAGHATLTLGWLDDRGLHEAGPDTRDLDLTDMPEGVTALEWSSLPDTRDLIEIPSAEEIKAAATALGCRHVDRGDRSDGAVIYWMVA